MPASDRSPIEPLELWDQIDGPSKTFALLAGTGADQLIDSVGAFRGFTVGHVGEMLTVEHPDGWRDPEPALRAFRVLTNLDVLFSPQVLMDPMRLLIRLSRRNSLVAAWPGVIAAGVASYSEPGRRDYFESPVPTEAVVVRTVPATFPDQAPFEVERI